jgi:thiamine-phosphate pyrophosphorylase
MIFYAISDRKQSETGELAGQLAKYFKLGIAWVQIREKDLSDGALFDAAKTFVEKTRTAGMKVFINGRADIAAISGAAGVHLPADSLPIRSVRSYFSNLTIVKSCHTFHEVQKAENDGADYVTLGPVFPTPSKESIGLDALEKTCSNCKIPVIALGGIGIGQIASVGNTGVYGIAGIRLFNEWNDGEEDNFRTLTKT